MEHTYNKPRFTRLASLLLALVMVLSMFPVTAKAAADSLVITNAEGEETDTFVVNEPIYVTASASNNDYWVALYHKDYSDKSAYWYYPNAEGNTNGETHNIFDHPNNGWAGYQVGEGTHRISLIGTDLYKDITIVAPASSETSLEVEETTITAGESLKVKATTYADQVWVALYSGTYSKNDTFGSDYLTYYYACGQNGVYHEIPVIEAGNYSVVMFTNGGYTADKVVNVTVEEASQEIKLLTTDKTEYKYGEPIMVTSAYGNPYWIGLYKQDDSAPTAAGPVSIYWLYPKANEAVNILTGEQQRGGEYVAGTYKVLLLAADYTVVASVENIVITTEYDPSKDVTVEAKCGIPGSITKYNTDGTVYSTEEIPALEHKFDGKPVYNENKKDHTYTCTQDGCTEPKKEDCSFDYEVTTPAENGKEGLGTYTCSVCGGSYTEVIPAKEVEDEVIDKEATCEEAGSKHYVYTDGTESDPIEIPQLTHKWGEWTYDEETGKHTRTCEHNTTDSCVETGDCSYQKTSNNNVYVCNTCEHEENLLTTNKTDYSYGEPILVSWNTKLYTPGTNDWIGFYWGGYTPSNANAATYWGYAGVTGEKNVLANGGNVIAHNNIGYGLEYQPSPTGGKIYTIYLLANDGYEVIAQVDVNVTTDWHESMVDVVEPSCGEDGYQTYKYYKDGRPWPEGAPAKTTLPATGNHTDEDTDHVCDVCTKPVGEHVAAGEDTHICEYCGESASDCSDNATDGDHKCDICGSTMDGVTCTDADKNHKCDDCGNDVGKHEDTNKDHTCDYGCDVIIGKCVDENKDHKCDYGCSETFGVCEDKNGDGKCDYGCDKKYETDPTEPDPTEPDPTEPDDKDEPKVEGVERVAGNDRFQTAVEVADQMKEVLGVEKFNTIIVASGATYADALPGSYLAIVKNAPILLGHSKVKYNALAQDYIKANLAEGGTVYILGGEAAVPASFETALEGIKIVRLAGENRFETNMLILKEAGVKEGDEIMVCTGTDYADALSASAAGKPILLVHKKLYDYQVEFLKGLKGNTFCVIGGEAAVKPEIETAVSAYGKTERLAGKDRMLTSHMVAERYFDGADTAVVAYGWNFPDGLCGGPLANALKSPLILTHTKEKLYNITAEFTKGADIKAGLVLGGTTLIPDAAVNAIYGVAPVALG